jgi:hypothetical protein
VFKDNHTINYLILNYKNIKMLDSEAKVSDYFARFERSKKTQIEIIDEAMFVDAESILPDRSFLKRDLRMTILDLGVVFGGIHTVYVRIGSLHMKQDTFVDSNDWAEFRAFARAHGVN